ncbi:YcgN family cysteine cluster protein [Endozoicomonas sp. OPT23]|uniref:YcgN family cysteine cluster protein n=1 Tax=Endozoicomonas sp. OPT23 TaxID=2072845 RepID=UPI00129BCEC7|nr:YcgN family cysteine cluster protein [Endozoicomonas sp. OPT23]MRI33530.1 YcgN family cysteine cluster protein [Endozoicomonas sp. OPT23]
MTDQASRPFWQRKNLEEMTRSEWESLCDGCGRCCLNKLIDDNTNEIHTVAIACKLLDLDTGRCCNYKHRRKFVPDCIMFTPKTLHEHLRWLPDSCAYRLLYDGFDLPDWHPLITGDPNSVHESGFSIKDKGMVSEEDVTDPADWFDYIIRVG